MRPGIVASAVVPPGCRLAPRVRPSSGRRECGGSGESLCILARLRPVVGRALFDSFLTFVLAHPVLIGLWVVLLIAFVVNESRRGGTTLSPQQVVDLINRQGAVVVDLRERKDFSAGHIVGALNIPSTALESRLDEIQNRKGHPIVLVCAMGQHAGTAGTTLRKAGFAQVTRLGGGMNEWRNSNLPLVKG